MSDPLLTDLLKARGYEVADPATFTEVARNEQIAALDALIADKAQGVRPAPVLSLRRGSRR